MRFFEVVPYPFRMTVSEDASNESFQERAAIVSARPFARKVNAIKSQFVTKLLP